MNNFYAFVIYKNDIKTVASDYLFLQNLNEKLFHFYTKWENSPRIPCIVKKSCLY